MFKSLVKTSLIALATLTSVSAYANEGDNFEIIVNSQDNDADIFANVAVTVDEVGDIIGLDASAVGNNFVIAADEAAPLRVINTQTSNSQNVVSLVDLEVKNSRETKIVAESIANKVVIVANGFGNNVVDNDQHNGAPVKQFQAHTTGEAKDPYSDVFINGENAEDQVNVASRSGGNSAHFFLGGTNNVVTSRQRNDLYDEETVAVEARESMAVNPNAKTFGNSLTIIVGDVQPK